MIDYNLLNFQYTYIYVAINLFCAFFSLLLLSKFSFQVGTSREICLFHLMNGTYLFYLVLEILWVLSVTETIPLPPLATGLIKALDSMIIPFMVYLWFWFAEERFHSKFAYKPLFKIIFSIPLALMIIMYASSFFTGAIFRITPQLTVEHGPLFFFTGIIDNFYGAAIIIHGAILYITGKREHDKKHYWTQVIFIGICTASGIFDAVFKTTPVMTLAIAFSFVYLFVNQLEPHIYSAYSDALTGLNNRRHADKYLLEFIEGTTPDNPFYLFMMDIDRFKEINDTLGHLEGDRALKIVSKAIDAVTDDFRGFAARWGGDEFVVMIRHPKEGSFPERFANAVDEKIKHHARQHLVEYPLGMSIGHAICDSTEDTISNIVDIADRMLYENKMRKLSACEV